MGTSVGVGYSIHRDPAAAGKEASFKALINAGIDKPDFVFVFATVGYDQQTLIKSIRETTSNAPLSGCSGEGIITTGIADETNFCVSVMVIGSDELRFNNAYATGIGLAPDKAGKQLASDIKPFMADDNIASFIFADGLSMNFDPFLANFENSVLSKKPLLLFGGLAADNWTAKRTYQYHNNEVFSDGISCAILSGKGDIAWGINHGCVPIGTERTITRCNRNIIYEIDGVPVLEALSEYMNDDWMIEWNKASLNLCLGFKTPENIRQFYNDHIIRYMMGKNDAEGYVTIQSEVKEGTTLWIVRRDKELIDIGLHEISKQIKSKMGAAKPKFIMQFDCVGRGKVVFREREKLELIRKLQDDIGPDIPWIGFYTYGEIGPIRQQNCFHNFTAVITAVY